MALVGTSVPQGHWAVSILTGGVAPGTRWAEARGAARRPECPGSTPTSKNGPAPKATPEVCKPAPSAAGRAGVESQITKLLWSTLTLLLVLPVL